MLRSCAHCGETVPMTSIGTTVIKCNASGKTTHYVTRILCCLGRHSGGSKGGMKVGGVKEISPNIIESTIGIL